MHSLRVAHLTPLYFDEKSCLGGGERYPLNIARAVQIASQGQCQPELISFGSKATKTTLAGGVPLVVLQAATQPANPLDVTSCDLPSALENYDLVHIHQAFTRCAEVGVLVARQLGKAVCVTDHGGASSPLGTEMGMLDLVDRIIAYSDFGASFYGSKRAIDVVKGGVDCSRFPVPIARPTRDRILFVGRILPHKGVDFLIDAMPSNLALTVCGRPYRPDYLTRLQSRAKGKRVNFVTDADDAQIESLYSRAWATVLPSVYRDSDGHTYDAPELMGFTLLESMACGTPGIASRVGGMPEFIRHGVDGFVFDNREELTQALTRLASDPDLVQAMGNAAAHHVRDTFDLPIVGSRILRIYHEAIATRRAAAA